MARLRRSKVQKYHDRVAGRYDDSYDDAYWRWHDGLTWDHLKAFLPVDLASEVADLGCGTGKWGLRLLASGYRVTFVDVSPKMLDQARARAEETGCAGRAAFVQADLMDLGALEEGRFGLATAFGEPIGCAATPAAALKEIRRILAPSGTLVATFDNRLAAIDYYLQSGDVTSLAQFLRSGRTHWLTRDRDEQFPIQTFAPADLARLFQAAGLELIDLVGKTVLPMRHHRQLLDDPPQRRRLAALEKTLWRDPAAIGRAAHLQAAARVRR